VRRTTTSEARFLLALLVCISCASDPSTRISASDFRDYGDTQLEHTIYLGSDESLHYFAWSSGKSGSEWKIEMPFRQEFERGAGETFLTTALDGSIQPHLGSP